MDTRDLGTYATNTWCPGCGDFAILTAIKTVLKVLNEEGFPLEKTVLVSGIGCHAKLVDYINTNSFYSIHGRVVPVAEGIKLACSEVNPVRNTEPTDMKNKISNGVKVIGFAGDGDAYGEGIEHLIFAAKRNIDITMIIHNNRVYGLTTGQYTPTSPLGFKGRSTPRGTSELPINPLELILASGATFIGRGTSHGIELLKKLFKEAIMHRGFALVDVLQVCVTYFNMYEYYDKRVYELKANDLQNFNSALTKIREWDYNSDSPIALGIFYKKEAPTFEDRFLRESQAVVNRDAQIKELLKDA